MMLVRLNEYKGRAADLGRRVSNADIAEGTGIGSRTVDNIAAGNYIEIRGEYIDAISTYFARLLGVEIDEVQLVTAEGVELPLELNIRPDRRGRRIGQSSPRGARRRANDHTQPQTLADFTALASEEVLASEWLTPAEDEAWADL